MYADDTTIYFNLEVTWTFHLGTVQGKTRNRTTPASINYLILAPTSPISNIWEPADGRARSSWRCLHSAWTKLSMCGAFFLYRFLLWGGGGLLLFQIFMRASMPNPKADGCTFSKLQHTSQHHFHLISTPPAHY